MQQVQPFKVFVQTPDAAPGAPQNAMEYRALLQRRSELGDQLASAQSRRGDLARELRSSDRVSAPGIEARLKVLDDRIIRLEQEIDQTGQAIANTSPEVLAAVRAEPQAMAIAPPAGPRFVDRFADDIIPMAGMFSVFFLLPLAIAFARLIWKRASVQPVARTAIGDAQVLQRFEQLQQSVDAIAVEVERISEGQRYTAKLLGDKERAAIRG